MILKLKTNTKFLSGRILDIVMGHVSRDSKSGGKGRHNETQGSYEKHKVICDLDRIHWDLPTDISFKVIQSQGQGPAELRLNLRSISSQDMNRKSELASDSETGDQYKISLGPDFRYQSRVTCHVT